MNWDDRKFRILQAIIHDYIQTAEPVGSRTLEKKYNLGISSATIRNEMSDLEDMGFLVKPHTSAGRIPSTNAYRLYVDNFMKKNDLDEEIRRTVRSQYNDYADELNKAIDQTLNILTRMTNYTSLMMAPRITSLNVKDIKLVYIDEDRIMLIVVTQEGLIRNSEIRLHMNITPEELNRVNNALILLSKDKTAEEIAALVGQVVEGLSEKENQLLYEIIPVFTKNASGDASSKIYSKGISKMLDFPEFGDIEKAKRFIDSVNSKEVLENAIALKQNENSNIHIIIGNENKVKDFNDCSIITADYKLNGHTVGTIGVIGPTRMNYDYAVSTLDFLSEELTQHIDRLFKK